MTGVLPTGKNDPGVWVLDDRDTIPELSVAVGSTQVTVLPLTPNVTVSNTSPMQETTGGILSTVWRNVLLLDFDFKNVLLNIGNESEHATTSVLQN